MRGEAYVEPSRVKREGMMTWRFTQPLEIWSEFDLMLWFNVILSYLGNVLFKLQRVVNMNVAPLLRGRAHRPSFLFALLSDSVNIELEGRLTLLREIKITFFFSRSYVSADSEIPSCGLKHSAQTNLWHTWLQPASF